MSAIDFVNRYSRRTFIANIGLTPSTFVYLFVRYCGDQTIINQPILLYELFAYYKQYPVSRNLIVISLDGCTSDSHILTRIKRSAEFLSSVISELRSDWINRFNHHLPSEVQQIFPLTITGSIDSFPIYVSRPKNAEWARFLYNKKYHGHVLKVQVVVNNIGVPIWYSGPHIGTDHDIRIARDYPPPVIASEGLLADRAYCGRAGPIWLVAPFKRRRGQAHLSGRQRAYNRVHRWYRATVEHSIGYCKRFRILSSVYRGRIQQDASEIEHAIKIIIHTSAYYIHSHPRRHHQPPLQNVNVNAISDMSSTDSSSSDDDDDPANAQPFDGFDPNTWDPARGTALTHQNLHRGQIVDVWITNDWWRGTITYVYSDTNRVNIKKFGSDHIVRNIMPKHVRYPR